MQQLVGSARAPVGQRWLPVDQSGIPSAELESQVSSRTTVGNAGAHIGDRPPLERAGGDARPPPQRNTYSQHLSPELARIVPETSPHRPPVRDRHDDVACVLTMLTDQLNQTRAVVEEAMRPDALYRVMSTSGEMTELISSLRGAQRRPGMETRLESFQRTCEERLEEVGNRLQDFTRQLDIERNARHVDVQELHATLIQEIANAAHDSKERGSALADIVKEVRVQMEDISSLQAAQCTQASLGCPPRKPIGRMHISPFSSGMLERLPGTGGSCGDGNKAVSGAPSLESDLAPSVDIAYLYEMMQEALSSTARLAENVNDERDKRCRETAQIRLSTLELEERLVALCGDGLTARSGGGSSSLHLDVAEAVADEVMDRGDGGLPLDAIATQESSPSEGCACRGEVAKFTKVLAAGLQSLDRRLLQEQATRQAMDSQLEAQLREVGAPIPERRGPPSTRMDSPRRR